jgi:hypothetical protein
MARYTGPVVGGGRCLRRAHPLPCIATQGSTIQALAMAGCAELCVRGLIEDGESGRRAVGAHRCRGGCRDPGGGHGLRVCLF